MTHEPISLEPTERDPIAALAAKLDGDHYRAMIRSLDAKQPNAARYMEALLYSYTEATRTQPTRAEVTQVMEATDRPLYKESIQFEKRNPVCAAMMKAFAIGEPKHGITHYPISYIATFGEMEKAAIAALSSQSDLQAKYDRAVSDAQFMFDLLWRGVIEPDTVSKPRKAELDEAVERMKALRDGTEIGETS